MVKCVPQCFDDFTVYHSSTLDERWGESGVTFLLVSMNMEEADSAFDGEVIREGKKVPVVDDSFLEVHPVLTHYVVQEQYECHQWNKFHCMYKRIVHVSETTLYRKTRPYLQYS